jgi:hypothetical protein
MTREAVFVAVPRDVYEQGNEADRQAMFMLEAAPIGRIEQVRYFVIPQAGSGG